MILLSNYKQIIEEIKKLVIHGTNPTSIQATSIRFEQAALDEYLNYFKEIKYLYFQKYPLWKDIIKDFFS